MTSLPTTNPRRAYFLLAHEVFHVLSRGGFSFSGMTSMRFLGSRPWTDSNTRPSSRSVASATRTRSSTYTH